MDPDQLASNVKVWGKRYVHSTFRQKQPLCLDYLTLLVKPRIFTGFLEIYNFMYFEG